MSPAYPPNFESSILSMDRTIRTKMQIFQYLYCLAILAIRFSHRSIGSEVLLILIVLFPYALMSMMVMNYVLAKKRIIASMPQSNPPYISAAGLESAQFWTKWALRLWPLSTTMAFSLFVLVLTEGVTRRVIFPITESPKDYCSYTGNQDGRALFACRSPSVDQSLSAKSLASLKADFLHRICTEQVFAWFRRSKTSFRFVYKAGWRTLARIDVSDSECAHPPPQPD